MTASTVYELAAGVFVDHKRGPDPKGIVHAVSWKPNREGARRSACGKTGRFLPPPPLPEFTGFPHGDDIAAGSPPRCDRCLLAKPDDIRKTDWT